MNIEKFKPAIVYTIYIASTPQMVWEALTSAEFSRKYFSGFAIEAELRVGGTFVAAHLTAPCISAAKCSNAIRRGG